MSETLASNSYDDVPYDSHPYAQTHPSRLATVATLFGLSPPRVEKCRVLELGCAAGGNLLPMAELFPQSEFVGIDLSARQIADGQRAIQQTGFSNITLRHASITDVDDTYGQFDFILCHGVFSWVPHAVQEAIFAVCAKRLTVNGIVYISYNTYPGWHMRGMIRDMMRYHAFRFDKPQDRIGQARALLDFLAQATNKDTGAYGILLRAELELLRKQSDHYLYHEQLEEYNQPLYFHQFMSRAQPHGLRYLGESRVASMVTGNFGADVQKTLAVLATDAIQTEQYLDFVRNRTFRETLLVRAEQQPRWEVQPDRIYGLHVGCSAKLTGKAPDLTTATATQFQSRSGMVLSVSSPLLKAAITLLTDVWPATIPFVELLRLAVAKLEREATTEDLQSLALGVLNTYLSSDMMELHAVPILINRAPSEKPVAFAAARVRAAAGFKSVANRRHELSLLNDLALRLIQLLDGTRDHEALTTALVACAVRGEMTVQRKGQAVLGEAELHEVLRDAVKTALAEFARDGVLAG